MILKTNQIDAFATKVFEGNPAMVVPLESWIDDDLMQKIAEKNNLSETAFSYIVTKLQLRNAYSNFKYRVCIPKLEFWNKSST